MNRRHQSDCPRLLMAARLVRAHAFALVIFPLALLLCAPAAAQGQDDYERLERAAGLIREGQLARAEAELGAVLRRRPDDANALNFLGVVRASQKRAREAEQLFLRALKSSPALVGAYVNLGRLYLEGGNQERALWAFTEADKLAPGREEIIFNLAAVHVERKEFEQALSALGKIPREALGVEDVRLMLASYLGLRRNDEAAAIAASLKRPGALPPEEAANFAALFAAHGLLDQAIEILEAARTASPNSYPLLYNLGASYSQRKDWARAEEFLTAALAARPDDVAALRSLARVARARGEMEKSLSFLIRARKLAPASAEVLYDFGLTALHMNLILDALPAFEELQRKRPDHPPYIYMLAAARLRKGEKGMAETLLRRYVGLRPKDSAGHYLLGVALNSLNRFSEARAAFEQSLALGPNPEAEYMLGLISNNEGDAAAAVRWLERALQAEPNHAAARGELGIAYFRQNNYEAARAALERAVELDPKDLRAVHQLGLVYAKLGDRERAGRMNALADELRKARREQETVLLKLVEPPQ
ncbi:MAG TPA: tetratricopeptide repeat protein [Pyrinomonadaceae bacterium]|nr:tetratricopeptide repeat protein [Pyrinomonadaceae bacterium]